LIQLFINLLFIQSHLLLLSGNGTFHNIEIYIYLLIHLIN